MDLALGDLKDRLKKSKSRSSHFKERIVKRTNLLNDIESEIEKRKEYSAELIDNDKLLRTRLIRNTEMKSALQNLADIAGYKLNRINNLNMFADLKNQSMFNISNENNNNYTNLFINRFGIAQKSLNTSSYTRYIEMAYAEVDQILINDKQSLIEIIRKLKTNQSKLKELEQLRNKVHSSLSRLNEFKSKLSNMINHDTQIQNTINKLETQIDFNLESLNSNFMVNRKSIPNNVAKMI